MSSLTALTNDVIRLGKSALDPIFSPRSVAVIGASETPGAVGRTILWNLISNPFGGTVYPVNHKRSSVLGIRSYKSIADVPAKVDLAVIATPAQTVPALIRDCAAAGVKAAVIVSAGFKELGATGEALEREVLANAREGRMRIIGPNCLGVMNPIGGLNATFAGAMAKRGNVAFISQSGALCTAILDWSLRENVGFSAFVSTGSMLDVGWGDLIDYLGNDPHTHSILIYMESIGDARSFLSAAREVALTKPIIVIKPGRTEQAARAAASHTGSLAGADDVLDAAFKRVGVLRVPTIADLFYMAEVLARQPRPRGPRLTILTNAGGPGVLATDSLIVNGGKLTELSKTTYSALNELLPEHWSRNNPIDILGDADADRYAKSLEIAAADENADGMLVILTPQDMTEPQATAEKLTNYAKIDGKPVLASWMGGPNVASGVDVLNRAGIPTFDYPDTAAKIFTYMYRYSENLRSVYETPALDDQGDLATEAVAGAKKIVADALTAGRTLLTERESKLVLGSFGVPVLQTLRCGTADEAVAAAGQVGYPVVLKLESRTITHKTDVGGVKLNIHSAEEVRIAFDDISSRVPHADFDGVTVQPMVKMSDSYELIVGSSVDAQLGPVMLVGAGGVLVEVLKDRALGLPPLNQTLAGLMLDQTKVYQALKGVRGRKPADVELLKRVLVRFSRLVVEMPRIREIDVNPLIVGPQGVIALDARILLHASSVPDEKLPHTAIRPYPTQYIWPGKLKSGASITIRPIRPEDEPLLVAFHETLSERTVRMRYFSPLQLNTRIAHERLTRVCFNDYDREMALVAELLDGVGKPHIIGIGRLSRVPGHNEAEFAALVSDLYQSQGLGTQLVSHLLEIAKQEKMDRVLADILNENREMQHICKRLGFKLSALEAGDSTLSAVYMVPRDV
jgi:acetyltransferase